MAVLQGVRGGQRPVPLTLMLATALLGACASNPKLSSPPASPPPPPALDPSYDWHALLVAPMGTALKDIHFTLHEVLLFRDASQVPAAADEAECYAIEGTTPQFLQHAATEFLLCFRHDRLARVEASVQLPAATAAQDVAAACGLWQKNAATGAKLDSGPPPVAPAAGGDACEGVQAAISYHAHLELSGEPDSLLSIKLDAADAVLERR